MITKERQYGMQNDWKNEGSVNMGLVLLQEVVMHGNVGEHITGSIFIKELLDRL